MQDVQLLAVLVQFAQGELHKRHVEDVVYK
jgi:hypothetical protein